MYGKLFAATFTGSMVGSGPVVFATWGYAIAHAVDSQVELNPVLLSAVLGCPQEQVTAAIGVLCAPDPNSRSKADEGRRLVREGQFAYRVVNHAKYNAMRHEGDRREYNRLKQQEHRDRKRAKERAATVARVGTVKEDAVYNLHLMAQETGKAKP